MGYPLDLFLDKDVVDGDLICSMCHDVLKDPVMLDSCEHLFCKSCINGWLQSANNCPLDRVEWNGSFKPPHRIILNFLNRLEIRCGNLSLGCPYYSTLGEIGGHEKCCKFSPNFVIPCKHGCGALLKRIQFATHNCMEYLKGQLAAKSLDNERLSEDLDIANQKIINKNYFIERLDSKIVILLKEKNNNLATMNKLEAKATALQKENITNINNISRLNSKIATLQKDNASNSTIDTLNSKISALEKENSTSASAIKKLNSKIATLQKDNSSNSNNSFRIGLLNSQIEALEKENKASISTNAKLNSTIATLQKDNSNNSFTIGLLNAKISGLEKENAARAFTIEELNSKVATLQKADASYKSSIRALQKENSTITSEMSALYPKIQTMAKENSLIRAKVYALTSENEKLRNQLNTSTTTSSASSAAAKTLPTKDTVLSVAAKILSSIYEPHLIQASEDFKQQYICTKLRAELKEKLTGDWSCEIFGENGSISVATDDLARLRPIVRLTTYSAAFDPKWFKTLNIWKFIETGGNCMNDADSD